MKLVETTKNYFLGVYNEIRKVVWPSRAQTINHTVIVIISVVIATIVFGLVDLGLSSIVNILIERR